MVILVHLANLFYAKVNIIMFTLLTHYWFWVRTVTMEFITSKLVVLVQNVETVILLSDDVLKIVILIYCYHAGL